MNDRISVGEERYVFSIESKGTTGEMLKECLLLLKYVRDNNGGGLHYDRRVPNA